MQSSLFLNYKYTPVFFRNSIAVRSCPARFSKPFRLSTASFRFILCRERPIESDLKRRHVFTSGITSGSIQYAHSVLENSPRTPRGSLLRTFALIVSAHPYCARKSTCHVMPRHAPSARAKYQWTMIGQMAIARALIGFNDLGRSVTPTFLLRNRFHLQLSPHCPKMNKKSMWEV